MPSGEELQAFVTIKADTKGVDTAVGNTVKGVKKLEPAFGEAEGGAKKFFESLKSQGGRRSALGETVELLRGAGSVIAVSMIGDAINKATNKIKELKEAYQSGKLDGTGAAVKIGESLPIIGSFVEAGQTIREMITGEEAFTASTEKAAAWLNKFSEAAIKSELALGRKTRGSNERAEDLAADAEGKGIIGEKNKERFGQSADYEGKKRSATDSRDDQLQDIKSKASEEMQKNEAEVREGFTSKFMSLAESLKNNPFDLEKARAKMEKDQQDEIERRNGIVKSQAKADSEQVKKNYDTETAAINKWNDAEKKRIEGLAQEKSELANATAKVGKSELDQYDIDLQQKGYSPDQRNELDAEKAKEIGAILHQSLITPFEKYQQENANLKQLMDRDAISKQDYIMAQAKNTAELMGSVKSSSVEENFMGSIESRSKIDNLFGSNVGGDDPTAPSVFRGSQSYRNAGRQALKQSGLDYSGDGWGKGGDNDNSKNNEQDPDTENTKATTDNTTQLSKLNQTLANGVTAVLG